MWARLELPKHTRGVIGISRRQGKVRDDAQPHDILGLIELSHRLMHGVAEF